MFLLQFWLEITPYIATIIYNQKFMSIKNFSIFIFLPISVLV